MERDLVHLMQRLFLPGAQPTQSGAWQPLVDVYRTRDGWLVKYDLAGVRPDDITLSVQGRRLTVRGSRRDCCLGETCGQYMMEIAYSHFERSIVLPEEVESYRLATDYRDGMLHVRLQREGQR
jgi:HSP20 family protein